MISGLLELNDAGLYCPPGDFYIDPWLPVSKAIITHAHSDHARAGMREYLIASPGQRVFQARLGNDSCITPLAYGESLVHRGVSISLHPAGHILGSAQVRLEYKGRVVVVSGDYKRHADPTCQGFEPIRCHVFVSESTFAMPIYRWPQPELVTDQINRWWHKNRDLGRNSVLYAYALGKAQRILATIDPSIGPIVEHGAVHRMTQAYRESAIRLPATETVSESPLKKTWSGALVLAPPSAQGSPWLRRFEPLSEGFASGWMMVRGVRRRRGVDRGFVLSDHADWPGLLKTIEESQAWEVYLTHGYTHTLARWLNERGVSARALETKYIGEADDPPVAASEMVTHEAVR